MPFATPRHPAAGLVADVVLHIVPVVVVVGVLMQSTALALAGVATFAVSRKVVRWNGFSLFYLNLACLKFLLGAELDRLVRGEQ